MATEVAKRLISVDEYYKMAEVGILKPGDRVELINGEIYEMSPIGSKHAAIVDRLARIFNQILINQASVRVQNPIRIDRNNEPEPDLSVLKYRLDDYISAHPGSTDVLIVIEVADSSIEYDKEVKAPLYATYGIPEYWIIDIENTQVEVLTKPVEQTYAKKETFRTDDEISLLDQKLTVSDLFPF